MANEMTSDAKHRKNVVAVKWDKDNTKQIKFKFNLRTDADILAKLESEPNVQGYVKRLIRADIARTSPASADQGEQSVQE